MKSYLIIILFVSLVFISCNRSDYEKSYQLENDSWDVENTLQFNFEINELNQHYNMFFNIRNTDNYTFSNIYLFVHILYPDNTEKTDTVEGILADSNGKWLGKGSGKYKNSEFLYKSDVRFPQAGKYGLIVEHAMRVKALEGIATVGFKMEKVKPE